MTAVAPDGRAVAGRVEDVFSTRNQLVEVRTDRGTVLTTGEQPLCLTTGGFRRATDLKAGDTVWYWSQAESKPDGNRESRRARAVVRSVTATGREEQVFNLILGDGAVFVAGDFLARGKPPAEANARP